MIVKGICYRVATFKIIIVPIVRGGAAGVGRLIDIIPAGIYRKIRGNGLIPLGISFAIAIGFRVCITVSIGISIFFRSCVFFCSIAAYLAERALCCNLLLAW